MIPVVFNAATAFLLDDTPSWVSDFVLDASITAVTERGLTGKETRRVTGDTLRLETRYTCLLTNSPAITNLRNSLQALADQQVLCPLWPAGFTAVASAPVTAAWYAVFNADGSFNSITAAAGLQTLLASLQYATAYPLMVGILKDTPKPTMITDTLCSVDFDFADSDNYPLTPAAFAAPNGLTAAGGVRPLFPFDAEWSTVPVTGGSEVDIDRQQLGNLRTLATVYYSQRHRRKVTQSFKLQNNDAFNLLRFFSDMGGETNNFWLGAAVSEAALTANVAAAATTLTVDNGAALGTNSFVLLNDNIQRVPLVVSNVAGDVWNLAAAPGAAFGMATTRIESLVLTRFDDLKLELNFSRPDLASATLKFCELPWETNAVAGETYGTTMGALPITAMLYTFTQTTPAGSTIWRFTNFERDLTDANGNVYSSRPIENEDIADVPNLERQNCTVKTRNFTGNPLALLIPFQLEFPLMVDIAEGSVVGNVVTAITAWFSGEVSDVSMDGPLLNATCASLSWIFDRTAARRIYQQADNWNLFEPNNGLTASDWQWNAVVVSYDATSATLVIGTIAANNPALNGATALTAHYFAAGSIQNTTAGAVQYRMVGDNTVLAGGQITLSLTSPLAIAPAVGDAVKIFAGYDGQYATAITKFKNGPAFGGFPFIPTGNPFVMKISTNNGGGKK